MAFLKKVGKRYNLLTSSIRCMSSQQQSKLLPTHSRLTQNVATWHRNYDKTAKGPLSSDQIEQYYYDGYVIIDNIIPAKNIKDCLKACDDMVDELANDLYKHGLITDLCSDKTKYNTFNRLTAINKQYPGAAVLLHKKGILPQEFIQLWELDILNDIAVQLIQPTSDNPKIAANPIWNIRPKLPQFEEGTVPWHQDVAYLESKCWNVHQLTAWIPLLNVSELEGCMQLIKHGHLSGNVATHTNCAGETWFVDLHQDIIQKELLKKNEKIKDKIINCNVDEGSVLFLGNTIPHRSLDNFSQKIRWSLDLRWQKYDEPNGLDDFKPNLVIRDTSNKQFKTDWDSWNQINRVTIVEDDKARKEWEDQFKPIIIGPWMEEHRWERVNQNKHTRAFDESQSIID